MRPWDRTSREQIVVLFVVAILHLSLGLLVIHDGRYQKVFPADTQVEITFLPPPARPEPSRSRVLKSHLESSHQVPFDSHKLPTEAPQAPEPNNAITAPDIGWDDEAEAVARQKSLDEEAEERRTDLAGPPDSQLDWARNNMRLVPDGDTERDSGGQVITWVDDKCFWTTSSPAFAAISQTKMVCKDPPQPDGDLFKDMRMKPDERHSTRLP